MAADSKNTILVTGGAGYIGSHTVLALIEAGREAVVVDDLSAGKRFLVPDHVPFVQCKVSDPAHIKEIIGDHGCGAVMHFAGSIIVEDSHRDPAKYYCNNAGESYALLETCLAARVDHFILSSTAAVYGAPETVPVPETAPLRPINPYGVTNLMTERVLRDLTNAAHMRMRRCAISTWRGPMRNCVAGNARRYRHI